MYACAFGFMPRRFEDTSEDRYIYQEEEEANEIYFFQTGMIGVGFGMIVNGLNTEDEIIAKRMSSGPQHHLIVGDHYVMNNYKS